MSRIGSTTGTPKAAALPIQTVPYPLVHIAARFRKRQREGDPPCRPEAAPSALTSCNRASAVVRVEYRGTGKGPRTLGVDCPACGERHAVNISWRKATAYDKGREPKLVLK